MSTEITTDSITLFDTSANRATFVVHELETYEITFKATGLGSAVFAPKDDITPLESVRIAHMFLLASATLGQFMSHNYGKFIKDNKLERHFTITT